MNTPSTASTEIDRLRLQTQQLATEQRELLARPQHDPVAFAAYTLKIRQHIRELQAHADYLRRSRSKVSQPQTCATCPGAPVVGLRMTSHVVHVSCSACGAAWITLQRRQSPRENDPPSLIR